MLCSGIQYYLLHFHDFHSRKYRTAYHSWTRGVSFTMKDIAETYYSEGFSLIGHTAKIQSQGINVISLLLLLSLEQF